MITTQQSAAPREGYDVEANARGIDELIRIASVGASRGTPVTFRGLGARPLGDLLKLVAAGGRWEGRIAAIASTRCQEDSEHRVSAADALLPGFLLSRFLCLPANAGATARDHR